MSRLVYDSTETLVYDPIAANRTATRAALYSLGFRRIETVATLGAFRDSIQKCPADLALCEAQGNVESLCAMIQEMRQGAAGYNPFIVIIVTAWEKNHALVTRVVDSGADDLLLRPFSTTLLRQRIETHVERRKGFIVTPEYVGPHRRDDGMRSSNAETFAPPNSLKMKAKERLTSEKAKLRLEAELKGARNVLNSKKLRLDAYQILVLWRLIQVQTSDAKTRSQELEKISVLAKDIVGRCVGAQLQKAQEWCDAILVALEGLRSGVDSNVAMHLLGHSAVSLNLVFQPEKSVPDILNEINSTVDIMCSSDRVAVLTRAS